MTYSNYPPGNHGQKLKARSYRMVRVNLSDDHMSRLDSLQGQTNMCAADIIRRAINEMYERFNGNAPVSLIEADPTVYDDDHYIEVIRKLRALDNTEDHIRHLLKIGSEMDDERIDKLMQTNQTNGD